MTAIVIMLNGADHQCPADATVYDLMMSLGLDRPGRAVAVNLEVVPKHEWAHQCLADGDRVDVVEAVGGG